MDEDDICGLCGGSGAADRPGISTAAARWGEDEPKRNDASETQIEEGD